MANDNQRLNLAMEIPYNVGMWQDSKSVTVQLTEGDNTLQFWRSQPSQYGLAIKDFTLTPVK